MKRNIIQIQINALDIGLTNYLQKHGYTTLDEIIPTGFYYARLLNNKIVSVHSFDTAEMRDDHMKGCLLLNYSYCPVFVKVLNYLDNLDNWWGFLRFETGRIEHIYKTRIEAEKHWKKPEVLLSLGIGDFVLVTVYNQELQCLTV